MRRVLVVEDDPILGKFLCEALGESGYEAVLTGNGDEALTLLAGGAVDIVLTDLLMPEQDGISLVGRLKRDWPELPVVAMSGRGLADLSIDSLSLVRMLGADATLEKPFTLAELERTIAFVLAR